MMPATWEFYNWGARAEKVRSQFLPVIYKDTNHQHRTASPRITSGLAEIYSLWMLPVTCRDSSVKDQYSSAHHASEPSTALSARNI